RRSQPLSLTSPAPVRSRRLALVQGIVLTPRPPGGLALGTATALVQLVCGQCYYAGRGPSPPLRRVGPRWLSWEPVKPSIATTSIRLRQASG
ncbi:hypothetical protein, partial [Actinomyces qiguomingii]|uniref:hypothetical protein n=1 Tax=Actinomyces qiguomingii TaxID=2057800 RepID=UPI001E5163E6